MKLRSFLTIPSFFILIFINSCGLDPVSNTEDEILNMELASILGQVGGTVGMASFVMPESDEFDKIPQDPKNPITAEKVRLGQMLYHETGLAVDPMNVTSVHTYSCASCHHVQAGFQAGMQQGIGEGGVGFGIQGEGREKNEDYIDLQVDVQPLRSPSTLNVAYQTNMLWNGQFGATGVNKGTEAFWTEFTPKESNFLGYEGVEIQAVAGLGVHRMDTDSGLINSTVYKDWFDQAFANIDESKRYTKEYIALAIAAYERTLLANESPFQRWLKGEKEAMNIEQKKGAILFFTKGNCGSCHKGPALNEMEFYSLGMDDMEGNNTIRATSANPANKGRGDFTGDPRDDFKFKVPQLYNLKDSPFYGHGGTFTSVKEVVEYKNNGVHSNSNVPTSQLAEEFVPLGLTEEEIGMITAFIEDALYDPNLVRYVPVEIPSGMCFPNNDASSKTDLNCN
ncbi:MAG: cytochrome-c peroxidase [Bacteroidia bacterium]|nr:cytochrome-c peroxidase [Bacteroidia bacterium]